MERGTLHSAARRVPLRSRHTRGSLAVALLRSGEARCALGAAYCHLLPPTAAVRCSFSPCGLELVVAPAPATPAGGWRQGRCLEVTLNPQPASLNSQPSTLDRKQEGGGEVDGDDLRENGPHYLQSKWILWFDGALQVK